MNVVHVSPTFFGDKSIVGGGERYPLQLASELARHTNTTLVTFASTRFSSKQGALSIEMFPHRRLRGCLGNPWSVTFLSSLLKADVIHVHQFSTMVADLSAIVG